jgi:pimeloyl-ACP methyl ester carboxylesterase
MSAAVNGIFLPGYGARASSYARGLPSGWEAVQPPPLRRTGGSISALAQWAEELLTDRSAPVVLAGHSLGGAVALLATTRAPDRVRALVLVGPAGLPLEHPYLRSIRATVAGALRRRYTTGEMAASLAEVGAAPRSALRLARTLERLDLSAEMAAVRAAGVPVTVVAADTDALVPPVSCRRAAELLGADYRELHVDGGHTWMYGRWARLRQELAAAAG